MVVKSELRALVEESLRQLAAAGKLRLTELPQIQIECNQES